jgi:phosphoribosylglycinamide formyltransferase 1
VSDGHRPQGGQPVKRRIAILISGRGSNMAAIVRSSQGGVLEPCCEVAVVVSDRQGAAGLRIARDLGVPVACVESCGKSRERFDAELLEVLEPRCVEYVVLAGFMRVLSAVFVRRFPGRIINIHPADTVLHQGLGGYQWAWERGLEQTAITVHQVDEGLDTGPAIARCPVDLRGAGSLAEVERRGLVVEHRFYVEVLRSVLDGSRALSAAEGRGAAPDGARPLAGRRMERL